MLVISLLNNRNFYRCFGTVLRIIFNDYCLFHTNIAIFAIISVDENLGCVPVGIKLYSLHKKNQFVAINAQIA